MIPICKHDNIPPCSECKMKPEPDAIAVDLICRLTKAYSELLWVTDDYMTDDVYCSSCGSKKKSQDESVHSEGCEGVKLIIESLNYVNT